VPTGNGVRACLCLVAVATLSGCIGSARPDLRRLYEPGAGQATVPPVIVIPGILGSRLRDRTTGEELWPGSVYGALLRVRPLALYIDPQTLEPRPDDVEAYDLFRSAFGADVYGSILDTLEREGGYVRGMPGRPADAGQRRYYVFPYDWRQDNVVTARKLDVLIEQIRRDYGDPRLRVDLVAHSMGGLVARYYLQYGTVDILDGNEFPANFSGAAKLRTVFLLGTPNLGSVSALQSFLVGTRVGLQRLPTEMLATMPSIYELLPHPINDWIIDTSGKPLPRDLFFAGTWLAYRWSVFDPRVIARIKSRFTDSAAADAYIDVLQRYFSRRLERARRFVWSLSYNESQHAPVKLVAFGGDCELTPARVVVEQEGTGDAGMKVRLVPREIHHPLPGVDYSRLMLEPGDGQVTKPSLLARQSLNPVQQRSEDVFFPLAYSFFLCEDHRHLAGNISFRDNLLNVLLSGEHPWDSSLGAESPLAAPSR
jgi:pimeloyl-ACP methyl ester carboxylesterase